MHDVSITQLGLAWAGNAVNSAVFRNDPITTAHGRQFAAYYDANGSVVIASRTLCETNWTTTVTPFTGHVTDAHNCISIIADGDGYLHLSWDHHDHPMRYARSKQPLSLEFELAEMTGQTEDHVTYPQFFQLASGDLIFLYRDGGSGRGNLVMNRYDLASRRWTQLYSNLIDGEGARNAYWQACVDSLGAIHLSWVWRESPNVATNHDICYACSKDGGRTWSDSNGEICSLPITAATAEFILLIPQGHELINQTSMCATDSGQPIIATYFRPPGEKVVQYFVISRWVDGWRTDRVTDRQTPFSLSGHGTRVIPIARPQVLSRSDGMRTYVWMIFRDIDRGSRVSVASCADLSNAFWQVGDLTEFAVGQWEPAFDRVRWQRDGVVSLYVQATGVAQPQLACVVDWTP